jgi:hypothetical protein
LREKAWELYHQRRNGKSGGGNGHEKTGVEDYLGAGYQEYGSQSFRSGALEALSRPAERAWQAVRERVGGESVMPEWEALHRQARVLMPKVVHPYTKLPECGRCSLGPICDGFHTDYVDIFGQQEAKAVKLPTKVTDPKHYIQHQLKVVEEQEYSWALPPEGRPGSGNPRGPSPEAGAPPPAGNGDGLVQISLNRR